MMNKDLLTDVVVEQHRVAWTDEYTPRLENFAGELITGEYAVVVSGIRRCGKSILLQEVRSKIVGESFYLNFEDDRLVQFELSDFQVLLEIWIGLYGDSKIVFFDEIQNVHGWERFVRRLVDQKYKIYITGSNANLLSRDLGTHLTGRYIQLELFPLSFKEFLSFHHSTQDYHGTNNRVRIKKAFQEYMQQGGFPQYLKSQNNDYLTALYESILYRDILARNRLFNDKQIKDMLYYIASNIGKEFSFSALGRLIGIKHTETIKDYLHLIQNTYLAFVVPQYHDSLRKQLFSPKKIYLIDTALARSLGFRISEDLGRMLENIVFIELLRRKCEVYYHKGKRECDFVTREGVHVCQAIQVTLSLRNTETKRREVEGMQEAMDHYDLDVGLIITEDEDDKIQIGNKTINVVSIWKWLL